MGMDLHGTHGDEWFSVDLWHVCLQCARKFGWRPEGTTDPLTDPDAEWGGIYFSNDGQQVSDRDARALGEALLRAVDALQAGDAGWLGDIGCESPAMTALVTMFGDVAPPKPTIKDLANGLGRLADYAILGGFRIF
jgi:hypothetical protein